MQRSALRIREWGLVLACTTVVLLPRVVRAQLPDSGAYLRGQMLEDANRYDSAAQAYREALASAPASVPAMLGLERVYAELGRSDSILPLLDSAIAIAPRETAFRVAQLRTLRSLGERDSARAAFERWRNDDPDDPAPYRTYARMLIDDGFTAAADTVLRAAQADLGSARGFAYELAQLRAAMGLWESSARSWREVLGDNPYLGQAALFSLAPTPAASRDAVRRALTSPGAGVGTARVLANLELLWGSPLAGWNALRTLQPDSAGVEAWTDFAQRAADARAWLAARDALVAANEVRPAPGLATRAASAALNGGDARGAAKLAESAEEKFDSASAARSVLPVHLHALAALGEPEEGERLLAAFSPYLEPDEHRSYARLVAWGWVRTGELDKARELLHDGDGGDGQIEGWLELYQGNLAGARERLSPSMTTRPELLTALALLERTRAEHSSEAGSAFLTLARGDTLAAAAAFKAAAGTLPEARSLLLATAARLYSARDALPEAMAIWKSIVETTPHAPEAPEADLEWARALRRSGDTQASVQRLEHLILTYSESALVPQARRELELARRAIPVGTDTSSRHRR